MLVRAITPAFGQHIYEFITISVYGPRLLNRHALILQPELTSMKRNLLQIKFVDKPNYVFSLPVRATGWPLDSNEATRSPG